MYICMYVLRRFTESSITAYHRYFKSYNDLIENKTIHKAMCHLILKVSVSVQVH